MIARLRTWLRSEALTAARAEIRQLHKDLAVEQAHCTKQVARIVELEQALSTEQMTTASVTSNVGELTKQLTTLKLRAEAAEAESARLRADTTYVQAERCECGGDAELHWRRVAVAALAQARRDRANAVRLTDELERVVHIAEQLERAR